MGGSVVDGIREVAERSGHEEGQQGEPQAESGGEGGQEEPAEERVAEGVRQVRVERQGRHEPPDLAVQHESRLAASDSRRLGPTARGLESEMKGQAAEGEGIGARDLETRNSAGRGQREASCPVGSLALIGAKDAHRSLARLWLDLDAETRFAPNQSRFEAFRGEYEHPFFGLASLRRARQRISGDVGLVGGHARHPCYRCKGRGRTAPRIQSRRDP
jgi:hypothetical protein